MSELKPFLILKVQAFQKLGPYLRPFQGLFTQLDLLSLEETAIKQNKARISSRGGLYLFISARVSPPWIDFCFLGAKYNLSSYVGEKKYNLCCLL